MIGKTSDFPKAKVAQLKYSEIQLDFDEATCNARSI